MSRLIDADILIEEINNLGWRLYDTLTLKGLSIALETINQQPTAFDVDKVEKELRSLKQYDNKYDSYYDHSMYMMTDFQNETGNRTIDKVLEIVKRGRIDEDM